MCEEPVRDTGIQVSGLVPMRLVAVSSLLIVSLLMSGHSWAEERAPSDVSHHQTVRALLDVVAAFRTA